jgi:hypothetical protein
MHEFLANILAPCLTEEPTSSAVIVVRAEHGAAYTLLNMGSLEAVATLLGAAAQIEASLGGNMEVMQ